MFGSREIRRFSLSVAETFAYYYCSSIRCVVLSRWLRLSISAVSICYLVFSETLKPDSYG